MAKFLLTLCVVLHGCVHHQSKDEPHSSWYATRERIHPDESWHCREVARIKSLHSQLGHSKSYLELEVHSSLFALGEILRRLSDLEISWKSTRPEDYPSLFSKEETRDPHLAYLQELRDIVNGHQVLIWSLFEEYQSLRGEIRSLFPTGVYDAPSDQAFARCRRLLWIRDEMRELVTRIADVQADIARNEELIRSLHPVHPASVKD